MANYPDGVLLIGGYLPCWLFNYVMSYVLRYILSHRKVRPRQKPEDGAGHHLLCG